MKPLNQPERRSRLWQFALLYLLALLIPLGASYFLFSNSSIAEENNRLREELVRTKNEQSQLIAQFDTLTQRLQRVDAVDQRMQTETKDLVLGQLTTINQNNIGAIDVSISELRRDSVQLQVPAHRRLARNVLRNFDLFRSNRNTMAILRQDLSKRGDAAKGSERLAMELAQAKNEAAQARQQVVLLQAIMNRPAPASTPAVAVAAPAPAPAPAPKPKAKPQGPPSISALMEMELLRDQLVYAEADCMRQRGLDQKANSKERRELMEKSRTVFIRLLEDPATADLKQKIEKTLEPINVELGRPPRSFSAL